MDTSGSMPELMMSSSLLGKSSIVSNLKVKQRCIFKQFIASNDNLEVDAKVFISNNQKGERAR